MRGSELGTQMACPGNWKHGLKPCGPIPGALTLTHTHTPHKDDKDPNGRRFHKMFQPPSTWSSFRCVEATCRFSGLKLVVSFQGAPNGASPTGFLQGHQPRPGIEVANKYQDAGVA